MEGPLAHHPYEPEKTKKRMMTVQILRFWSSGLIETRDKSGNVCAVSRHCSSRLRTDFESYRLISVTISLSKMISFGLVAKGGEPDAIVIAFGGTQETRTDYCRETMENNLEMKLRPIDHYRDWVLK
ncbi:hypothetical protein E3N88_38191 [Mikania micrantha]|uniref:Uncharacterized protein n=1 Tax=Mikania micrantha TaxID=192012 RepID=A0A5N6LTA2_9ASTR|nr:hypothetical protein E3N88_38191 [Mikania micrantha]